MLQKAIHTFELIKFSHSIFALPFALGAMVVAARGWPGTKTFLLILAAMVTARSAAMAFNRFVDAEIDAKNPRTQNRHIPQGILSKKFVLIFTAVCSILFLVTCYFINSLSFALSPLVLLWILAYPYTKRFTWFTHFWLGISLGLAPLGAWIAVTNQWPWLAIPLALAVAFWVAGFDIIYATQDEAFDRKAGIQSIVARFGIEKALFVALSLHGTCVIILMSFGYHNQLGKIYPLFLLFILLALFYEYRLVSPNDLSKVNTAFFHTNAVVGLLFFVGILLETLLRR